MPAPSRPTPQPALIRAAVSTWTRPRAGPWPSVLIARAWPPLLGESAGHRAAGLGLWSQGRLGIWKPAAIGLACEVKQTAGPWSHSPLRLPLPLSFTFSDGLAIRPGFW